MSPKEFLSKFSLADCKRPLRRFGAAKDGGYILVDHRLEEIRRVYSYGIGGETIFEEAILEVLPECAVFGLDPTIEGVPWLDHEARFKFAKLGLACGTGTLLEHRAQFGDKDEPFIVKADVEGAEVPWLLNEMPGSQCKQIVMELHGLETPEKWPAIAGALDNLRAGFALVHAHVNNYADPCFTKYRALSVPSTLELTFLRYSLLGPGAEPNKRPLPVPGLDFSNNPQIPDPPLNGWPWQKNAAG